MMHETLEFNFFCVKFTNFNQNRVATVVFNLKDLSLPPKKKQKTKNKKQKTDAMFL